MNTISIRKNRIKLKILALFCALIFCFCALFSTFANAKVFTGNLTVNIKRQLKLSEERGMDFAQIYPVAAGDTITLTHASAISASGGSTFGGTPLSAEFEITGQKDAFVNISFSTGDVLTGPGASMALDNFVSSVGTSVQFPTTGKITTFVGADLTVNASQASGSYNGTYTMTVEYQ